MTEELAVSPWDETQQGDSARAGEPPVLVCETTTEGEESMKGIITEIERFALKDGPGHHSVFQGVQHGVQMVP